MDKKPIRDLVRATEDLGGYDAERERTLFLKEPPKIGGDAVPPPVGSWWWVQTNAGQRRARLMAIRPRGGGPDTWVVATDD